MKVCSHVKKKKKKRKKGKKKKKKRREMIDLVGLKRRSNPWSGGDDDVPNCRFFVGLRWGMKKAVAGKG